jgi:polyphosphate kinase
MPALRVDLYLNREFSQIEFNRRVLALAADARVPVLERLRYLCIFDRNLDEFFEIRVTALRAKTGLRGAPDADGKLDRQLLEDVGRKMRKLVALQYNILNTQVLPLLASNGIRILQHTEWNNRQKAWIHNYFMREMMPVLTPICLDPSHPFPRLLNKSLNFVVELKGKDAFGRQSGMAILQAPRVLPRVIALPSSIAGSQYGFVLLSSILSAHIGKFFHGMAVLGCYHFRLTRNSALYIDPEEVRELKSLRKAVQSELSQRQHGDPVRLEVADKCPPHLSDQLLHKFGLSESDLYQINGPANLFRLQVIVELVDRPELKFPAFTAGTPRELLRHPSIFDCIRRGDVLLHHPYQSFQPVINFIAQAANDPHVVAIKQTVYRTDSQSMMMDLLIQAARSGKAVTVLIELMARFDEEANVIWAERLKEAGANVIYGVAGYKMHAKMALVVRREGKVLRSYVHLGTGNYHLITSNLYTDFGIFTCNKEICADVNELFISITGARSPPSLKQCLIAPFTLHKGMMQAILNEACLAKAGRKAHIMACVNALLEPKIIAALYAASQAGVTIDLIVRGACSLRPGLSGVSDNIRVRSVLGRFLEHSRVFYFHNDGVENVYLSSADWMDRNLFHRVEICFPVLDPRLKKRVIREGLTTLLSRDAEGWEMDSAGNYHLHKGNRRRGGHPQTAMLELLSGKPAH